MKQTIKLNEAQLRQIVAESVVRVINESNVDEGFWDNVKSAWQGAKAGYQTQQSLDKDVNGFKQHQDAEDRAKMANPLAGRPERTAAEEANYLLQLAQQYQTKANQLRARANQMTSKYKLAKSGVNQRVSTVPNTYRGAVGIAGSGNVNGGTLGQTLAGKRQFARPNTPMKRP